MADESINAYNDGKEEGRKEIIEKIIEELEIIIDAEQVTYNYEDTYNYEEPKWVIPKEKLESYIKDLQARKSQMEVRNR